MKPPDMTDEEIRAFIDSNVWTFAKTMPQNPHEYCVKKKCPDPRAFEQFVHHINRNGYEQLYVNRVYICFDFGEHFYWTMDRQLARTVLINRKLLSQKGDRPVYPK